MNSRATNRAFSLAEVMLAMFILGIGIVAIASIFPAGIAQQRQSADDIIGPIVADNALAVLRTKLRPEDFGTFEEFLVTPDLATIPGDWPWRRPGFFMAPRSVTLPGGTTIQIRTGAISVFDYAPSLPDLRSEVPWNSSLYPNVPPLNGPRLVTFSQRERYYPMQHEPLPGAATDPPRPEYVWDCMFRRFQGRTLVAIFVYRVSFTGGGAAPWVVPPGISNSGPPMPVHVDLTNPSTGHPWSGKAWSALGADPSPNVPQDDAEIPFTGAGQAYEPADPGQSWQSPGHWILDQNNNIIRVLAGRRSQDDGPVELVRPVAPIVGSLPVVPADYKYLGSPYYFDPNPPGGLAFRGIENIVTNIWYIPAEVTMDTNLDGMIDESDLPVSLTPVYIGVSEL